MKRERDNLIKRKTRLENERYKSRGDEYNRRLIEFDQMKIEVKIQASRRLALLEQEYSELQDKQLLLFKKELGTRFDLDKSVKHH